MACLLNCLKERKMTDIKFLCQDCEAEFTIEHDGIDTVMFCPFCASRLNYDDTGIDEDWDDEEENDRDRGC